MRRGGAGVHGAGVAQGMRRGAAVPAAADWLAARLAAL